MSRRAGWRRSWSEPLEVGEPDLDQRPHRVLEARLASDGERLLVALARFRRAGALLQPVVPRDEQLLDALARLGNVHLASVARRPGTAPGRWYPGSPMLAVLAVAQVLLSFALIVLVLLHSGRDTGLAGMGFTPASQGGTHIVERNLTRLTVAVGIVFTINTVALYHLLK